MITETVKTTMDNPGLVDSKAQGSNYSMGTLA